MLNRHVFVRRAAVAAAALAGAGAATTSRGAVVSVDWGTTATAMGATETAGVVPAQNWNAITTGNSIGGRALVTDAGAATTATVQWSNGTPSATSIANTAGNFRMMAGYLDTATNTTNLVVTLAGLTTAVTTEAYAVIVYYDGSNGTGERVGSYTLAGATSGNGTLYGRDAASTQFGGSFVQAQSASPPSPATGANAPQANFNPAGAQSIPAGNYLVFTNVTGSGFTLTATPSASSDNPMRAALNGIQIVPMSAVPEPGSVATVLAAGSGLLLRRSRRRS